MNFRRSSVSRGRTRWCTRLVYYLVDGASKLRLSMSELGAKQDKAEEATMNQFGGRSLQQKGQRASSS